MSRGGPERSGAGEDGGAGRTGGGGGEPELIRRPGRGMEGERADGPAAPADSGTSEVFAQLWADVMGILVSVVRTGSGSGAAVGAAYRGTRAWGGGMEMLRSGRRVFPAPAAEFARVGACPPCAGAYVPEETNFTGKTTGCVGDRLHRCSGGALWAVAVEGAEGPRQGAGRGRGCPLAGTLPGGERWFSRINGHIVPRWPGVPPIRGSSG